MIIKAKCDFYQISFAALFILSMVFINTEALAEDHSAFLRPTEVPAPSNNQLSKVRIDLGKKLFFDPRLSGSNWISCGTCHNPALGWSDGLKTAIGEGQKVLGRATPSLVNTAYNEHQFWDGRSKTLEDQALGPIAAAGEMNQDLDKLVTELKGIPGYVTLFKRAFGKKGISKKTIGMAIANFERTIVSTESRFDQWIKGDRNALSKSEQRGFKLFSNKAQCATCHGGFNFTDNQFHNIGIGNSDDIGRFAVENDVTLKGAMKTPTLRDISLTAPYMHNGKYATLKQVVEHYNRGGDRMDNKSPLIKRLNLKAKEKKDLVAFLKSLTGKFEPVSLPRLPN